MLFLIFLSGAIFSISIASLMGLFDRKNPLSQSARVALSEVTCGKCKIASEDEHFIEFSCSCDYCYNDGLVVDKSNYQVLSHNKLLDLKTNFQEWRKCRPNENAALDDFIEFIRTRP
jgi:hypothetical protein